MKCDELKVHKAYNRWIDEEMPTPNDDLICNEVYLKDEVDAAIAELKQKLEDAKATAYAESVDAGMRERRLRRALWLTRGAVHKAKRLAMYGLLQAYPLWEGTPAGKEVHKKIFRYDGYERKCRAKAEEYK